ncbi:MAG: FecR domain-containing protein [Spirochaetes bacterium]|nr:FecR domain-containing protein [Spirochaetota bacterium]
MRACRAVIAALAIFLLCTCGGDRKPPDGDMPAGTRPATESARPPAAEAERPASARPTVAYVEGDVRRGSGGSWSALAIGDAVGNGETVRTGKDGVCELSFSGRAVVRIQPDSQATVTDAWLESGATKVRIALAAGTVYNKVDKLLGGDSYNVATDHGIAGVRGTEFTVSAGREGTTKVAVRRGTVTVLVRSRSVDALLEEARGNLLARIAMETAVLLAPRVGENQELVVGATAMAAAEASARPVAAELASTPPVETPDAGDFLAAIPAEPRETIIPPAAAEKAAKVRGEAGRRFAKPPATPVKAGAATRKEFLRFDEMKTPVSGGPESPGSSEAPGEGSSGAAVAAGKEKPGKAPYDEYAVSRWQLTGSITQLPGAATFLCADNKGTVFALTPDGRPLWSVPTANKGSDRGYPVTFKGAVYYSGGAEFLIIDGASGDVRARTPLEPNRSHVFGSRVVPFPNALLFPTNDGMDVLDPVGGAVQRSIPVADGTGMTPANYQGMAAIVNNKGVFMLIDVADGRVVMQVPTNAVQPIALAPRTFEDKAVFADRKGLIVLVDLTAGTVAWERKIPEGVFSDVEINREGVFAFGKSSIFGYRLDGSAAMETITGVTAPPLLSRGMLYYGTGDREFIVAETSPWRIVRRIKIGETVSTRPLLGDGCLYVGTKSGKILRIDVNG